MHEEKPYELYEKRALQKNNFPIAYYSLTKNTELYPHWHEHIEILYFKNGKCTFNCSGNKYTATKGDFICVNSREIHSHFSPETTDYICLLIYPHFFSDVDFPDVTICNYIKDDKEISQIMNKLEYEYDNYSVCSDMIIKGLVYTLVAYLVRNYSKPAVSKHNLELFAKAETYIESHYSERITRDDIAKLCYVSNSYISRYFKDITGKTLMEYINEYRIKKSMTRIEEGNVSISSIALLSGFEDINYFSRVFKKVTTMTPSQYKKLVLNKKISKSNEIKIV